MHEICQNFYTTINFEKSTKTIAMLCSLVHISKVQFCPFRFFLLVWIFPICGDILVTGDRQFYESFPPFMPLLLSRRNVDIPQKGNTFQGSYEVEDNRLLNDSSTPRACDFHLLFLTSLGQFFLYQFSSVCF